MRVALNLLYLIPGEVGGTETYGRSLVEALAAVDQCTEYLLYLNRESAELPLRLSPNFRRIVVPVRARGRAARYAAEQTVLPRMVARARAHVLHSLGYVGPLLAPCPHAVSVHDLNFLGHGASMSRARRLVLRAFITASVRRADHVVTISHFSRGEILTHFRLPPERVSVTPAAGRPPTPLDGAVPWSVVAECHRLMQRYVVAFASASAHKNVPRLVQAFAASGLAATHQLVLVGHVARAGEVARTVDALGLGARVAVTGYVPDAHVMPLLQHASVFAFPSLYEGFGLPLLDAQAAGVPVVAARTAALPEVAGDAAILCDPLSVADMAGALRRAAEDRSLRARLVRLGHENVARYSWARTATQTLAVYHRLAGAAV